MISEGITDIAMELILKGQPGLNWAYAKAKAISYGISLITGGIAKLAQCEKVMKASIKACKSLSKVLKESPIMTKLCTNIADKIEKLGKWLEKVHEVSKFNQLSKVKQLEQLENLKKAGDLEKFTTLGGLKTLQDLQKLEGLGKLKDLSKLHTVAKLTGKSVVSGVKGVATSVAMEKIVTASLQEIMQGIKPRLKETIKESINKNIDKEAVISATNIEEALIKAHKQTTGEIISEVAYEIALGLTRPYGDWRVKAGYLAVDSILSSYKMYNYTEEFCKKFNKNLTKGEVVKNDIEKIIEKLAEQLSETVFGMVVSSTGKIAVNLPGIIKGAAGAAYKKHQKKKEEQIKKEQDEIARLEKDVAEQQQHEAEKIKAGKEPKECVGLTLDSLNPAGRSEDGLGPKTQSEVRELIENSLAKDGSKAYEENLGTLNRKEILNALKKHGGSEGMLLLSREDGSIGHAVKVQKVGSKLILVDPQSGKVMDHQQAKAYFSEHNYSKAAVMGVQPAGFKEGIGQKSVRKFKELTGIDAGPGKPFDKDIEFAGKPGCKSDQLKVKIEKAAKKSTPVEPQISIPHAPGFAKLEERQYSTKNPKHPMANAKKQALDFLDKHDSFRTHTTQNGIQQNVESICHLDTRDSGSNKFATEIQLHRAKNNKTTIGVVHYTDKLGSRSKRRVKDFYRNRTSYNSEWFK
jgi:phosphoribosylformimino-5-aminoimidazole carboxamide ribonucleotide (ProFAR) isomerase